MSRKGSSGRRGQSGRRDQILRGWKATVRIGEEKGALLFPDGQRDSKEMPPALMKVSPGTSKTGTGNILLTERGSLAHKTLTFWGSLTRF